MNGISIEVDEIMFIMDGILSNVNELGSNVDETRKHVFF